MEFLYQWFFRPLCCWALQLSDAADLSLRCGVGWSWRLLIAMGFLVIHLDIFSCATLQVSGWVHGSACDWCLGFSAYRSFIICSTDLESFWKTVASCARWPLFKSPVARSWSGISSANVIHGLCGLLSSLCICDCFFIIRSIRCCLGALVASLDNGSVGISDSRYCLGVLVGLLRIGLGRLVVLGSRWECILHTLVGWYCVATFFSGYREAWRL